MRYIDFILTALLALANLALYLAGAPASWLNIAALLVCIAIGGVRIYLLGRHDD